MRGRTFVLASFAAAAAGVALVALLAEPEPAPKAKRSWKPPANDVPTQRAPAPRPQGAAQSPEFLSVMRQAVESQGLWCGAVKHVLPDQFRSSPNKRVFHVACDDGREAVNYEMAFTRDFQLLSVTEK